MSRPDHTVYMDHASTSPLREEALYAMMPYFSADYGNPGSPHSIGAIARHAVEEARQTIAQCLNCKPSEVFFTSGGTESDNWAIKCWPYTRSQSRPRIVASAVEHHAVLRSCEFMGTMGCDIVHLPVSSHGMVSLPDVDEAVNDRTSIVSVMLANNEVGTLQPVRDIAGIAHSMGAVMHTDATQAVGHMPVDFSSLDCDLMSFSAHKFGGPKGVGALIIRGNLYMHPLFDGGHQELGLRASTENVPSIVGMAEALRVACHSMERESLHVRNLAERLISGIRLIPGVIFTGHPTVRLPNIVSMLVEGVESEALLIRLDQAGICASSGAACTTGSLEPSHVLTAMGLADKGAPLRLSLARSNTMEEADYVVTKLSQIVSDLRALS